MPMPLPMPTPTPMAKALPIDQVRRVQQDLHVQLTQLVGTMQRASVPQTVAAIDRVRRMAHDGGFTVVARLASTLESAIARGGRSATMRVYLDAMQDAVVLTPGSVSPAQQEALLASVALRLNG